MMAITAYNSRRTVSRGRSFGIACKAQSLAQQRMARIQQRRSTHLAAIAKLMLLADSDSQKGNRPLSFRDAILHQGLVRGSFSAVDVAWLGSIA